MNRVRALVSQGAGVSVREAWYHPGEAVLCRRHLIYAQTVTKDVHSFFLFFSKHLLRAYSLPGSITKLGV